MPRARSHYEVLGVSHDAPSDEVRKAYRRLALVLHPDKRAAGVTEDEAKDRFQRLVEAFKVVGDETARREYDESHASDIFAAEATAPTGGGVHDRDSWNDVIAKLNQRAKRAKKDLAKKDRVMKRLIPKFGNACLESRGDAFNPMGALVKAVLINSGHYIKGTYGNKQRILRVAELSPH